VQPSGAVVEWVTYDVYGKATIRDKASPGVSTPASAGVGQLSQAHHLVVGPTLTLLRLRILCSVTLGCYRHECCAAGSRRGDTPISRKLKLNCWARSPPSRRPGPISVSLPRRSLRGGWGFSLAAVQQSGRTAQRLGRLRRDGV